MPGKHTAAGHPSDDRPPESLGRGITVRSILLGVAMSVAVGVWVNYVEFSLNNARMTLSHFPMGTLMIYLSLVFLANPVYRWLSRGPGLSSTELLVILAGGLAGGTIPAIGMTGYILGALAAPYYFATTENQWAEYLHPHIPGWVAPQNVDQSMADLFEGLPSGSPIPWDAWYVPLAWWTALATALFLAYAGLAVILRRQWVHNEHLTYPVLRPAMEITAWSKVRGLPRLFWVGFGLAFGILAWNTVKHFVPWFPEIPNIRWAPWIHFGRHFPGIWTRVNMFIISFAYFAQINILFSLWFFDVLFILYSGILNRFGFDASTQYHASASFIWFPAGAFFALVLWSIWTARHHLKAVARKGLGLGGPSAEGEEMMTYRAAFLCVAAGVVFVVCWLLQAGMQMGVAFLYLLATVGISIGVSRIVADVGLVFVSAPVAAPKFVVDALGSRNLSASSLTVLAFSNTLTSYGKGLFLPALTHTAKIADECPAPHRRRLFAGVVLAFLAGTVASFAYLLYVGYTQGAYNFNRFHGYGVYCFSQAMAQMRNPAPPDVQGLSLFVIGIATMSLLTILKYRLPWWPLHPIGFAIGSAGSYVRYTVFSVFIAWAIKSVMLRTGGSALYRRYRPFFLGVLTGYTAGIGLAIVLDMIWFPSAGHMIHGY